MINKYITIKILGILGMTILIPLIMLSYRKIFNIKVCVCTIARHENVYAREFVEHYKKYGVDKIFIYDNNDQEDQQLESYISDYINNGFVKIINYREKKKIQLKAFNKCYRNNKEIFDWFIFYDMDEYIHLSKINNIKYYLSNSSFKKCNVIYLNQVIRY